MTETPLVRLNGRNIYVHQTKEIDQLFQGFVGVALVVIPIALAVLASVLR